MVVVAAVDVEKEEGKGGRSLGPSALPAPAGAVQSALLSLGPKNPGFLRARGPEVASPRQRGPRGPLLLQLGCGC